MSAVCVECLSTIPYHFSLSLSLWYVCGASLCDYTPYTHTHTYHLGKATSSENSEIISARTNCNCALLSSGLIPGRGSSTGARGLLARTAWKFVSLRAAAGSLSSRKSQK